MLADCVGYIVEELALRPLVAFVRNVLELHCINAAQQQSIMSAMTLSCVLSSSLLTLCSHKHV